MGKHGAGTAGQVSGPEDFAAAFEVSRETLARLELYAALLHRWSKVQDLVAPGTLPELWHRHFADSAQLLSLGGEAARIWVDVGSGAGFPGLVVAILATGRPGFRMHLVESNARKCAFLGDVARQTGAPVDIHNRRSESVEKGLIIPSVDVVTARALAPLGKLLGLCSPFFGDATRGLFPKGRGALEEIGEARRLWEFEAVCHPSRTDPDGRVVEIRALVALKRG